MDKTSWIFERNTSDSISTIWNQNFWHKDWWATGKCQCINAMGWL